MKYSSLESEYLVSLIISAVNSKPAPPSPEGIDWEKLVKLAESQQVYSVICESDFVGMPSKQAEEIKLYNQNELLRTIAMKSELDAIEAELASNGIKHILLKGVVLRNYYPKQKMRQMSDIDILYDSSKQSVIFDIMKQRGFICSNSDDNSDDFIKKPFYTFEFHRELFFKESDFCPEFNYVWDNAVQDGENEFLYRMKLEDMYVYNICHMYKHFRKNCCGIRFLLDNYLFLSKESDKLDWAYIDKYLEKFGICEYERRARQIAFKVFNGERLNDEEKKQLFLYTSFGVYGDEDGHAVRRFSEYSKKNGKLLSWIKFIFRRLFPEKDDMKYDYPFVESKPYLMIFAYIHRLIKAVFNPAKIISTLKSVGKFSK